METELLDLRSKGVGYLEEYAETALKSSHGPENHTTLLHTAVRLKDPYLSKQRVEIITEKADITNVADVCLNTPLHYAVSLNRLLVVKELLRHGADVSVEDSGGQTALHIAVRQRQASIVANLLRQSKTPMIDAKDNSGQTALHLACSGGFTDIVSMLLDSDAATDLMDKASRTPEMMTHADEYEEISALLQQARNSRRRTTEAPSCDNLVKQTAQLPKTDQPVPDQAPAPTEDPCSCEICKLIDISTKLNESLSEEGQKCICIDCLKQMAIDTISDFDLVKKTLETCVCVACVKAQCTTHGGETAGGENIENIQTVSDRELDGKIDFAALDAHYEAILALEENKAPYERANDNAQQRTRDCTRMLSSGVFAHINYRTSPNKALLMVIDQRKTLKKLTDIVLFLLENGADIELRDKEGDNLLHIGAIRGDIALVRMLLQRGANYGAGSYIKVTFKSYNTTWTPLRYAILYRHGTIAYLLLTAGAKVDEQIIYGRHPLHNASMFETRYDPMLRLLLRFTPNLELAGYRSQTALHLAIECSSAVGASYLLGAGANIEAPGEDGYKPLALAIQSRNQAMVQLLLKRKANVHCCCGPYPNALMYAAHTGGRAILGELMYKTTAIDNLSACDSEGRTVMHVFAQGDQVRDEIADMLQMLSGSGASLDAQDWNGATPLHLAVLKGSVIMVSNLLDIGLDKTKRNWAGKTALDLATAKRNEEMVKILGGDLKKRWYRRL